MDRNIPGSILIVGEDSYFCYLLRSFARSSACRTLFSFPGDGVLEIAQREQPSAIVVDMDIPAKGALAILRNLKANQATRDIPVVMCTWLDEHAQEAQDEPCYYLHMPLLYVDFQNILSRIGIRGNPENI